MKFPSNILNSSVGGGGGEWKLHLMAFLKGSTGEKAILKTVFKMYITISK